MDMGTQKWIKRELENNKTLIECAGQFGLVGDPTRMKICWLLCRHPELSVGEIAGMLGTSQSVVSHSLKRLRASKLVDSRREYKQVFYSFSDTKFNRLLKKTLTNL